jgi:hypothetical protein
MIKIVKENPPNFEDIIKVLPAATQAGVIFAYDGVIYAPGDYDLPQWLIAHEEVHFAQQEFVGGAAIWWERYLADPEFRYAEEIVAHRTELRVFNACTKDREAKVKHRLVCSVRLSSEQYGNIRTQGEVWKDLKL